MDIKYMLRALDLAKLGKGYVNPNPLVGAVIVKENRIVGEGYHKKYGEPHAEINAFRNAIEDVTEAILYVTLEPCSHFGKTPPCVDEILRRGIKKVVIAMEDPNPLVSGRGIDKLKSYGVEVVVGLLQNEAKKLNETFIKFITTNMPFCTIKTAMTLDGKIATHTGNSKWITNEMSRKHTHVLRHEYASIMVGIGTIIEDNPHLTTRLNQVYSKNPIRVIVDSRGRIPLVANVLDCNDDKKTIIAVTDLADKEKLKAIENKGAKVIVTPNQDKKVDLQFLMKSLGEMKINSVLVEGGSTLNYSLLHEGLVDKMITFIAPKIIGGNSAKTSVGGQGIAYIDDCILLRDMNISKFDDDLMIEAYVRKGNR